MTNSLKAIRRETKTVGQLNALRTKGLIPAVLYGGKNPNLKISVEEKYLKFLKSHSNKIFYQKDLSF